MKQLRTLVLVVVMTVPIGCDSDDGAELAQPSDAGPATEVDPSAHPEDVSIAPQDASAEPHEGGSVFTHKMIKQTGVTPFESLAYECSQCTFEQWESIDPPEGWSKGPAQQALFSAERSALRSYPEVEGHPDSVDFLDEVPGDEYRVIAINQSGRLVESGTGGIVAEVQVQRDTLLVWTAGMRVHELTDPEGSVFVLFAHHVDTGDGQDADFQSEDALSYFTEPAGWSYSTRTLEEDLELDSNNHDGVVTVLAIRGAVNSTWEKR